RLNPLLLGKLICILIILSVFFFFFQAEDGIRDDLVTGVQTCALPISATGTRGIRGRARHTPAARPRDTRRGRAPRRSPRRRLSSGASRRHSRSGRGGRRPGPPAGGRNADTSWPTRRHRSGTAAR